MISLLRSKETGYKLVIPLGWKPILFYLFYILLFFLLLLLIKYIFSAISFYRANHHLQPTFREFSHLDASHQKTVLVTGGASGIGAAYVKFLLLNEYRVVVIDKNQPLLSKQIQLWKQEYPNCHVKDIVCDLTNKEASQQAFAQASSFATDKILDCIILNAGIIDNMFSHTQEIIQTNLWAPIYESELYIRQITSDLKHSSKKPTQIIITGSLASFVPIDINLAPVYDSTKVGIGQFVRSCRPIAKRYGFRINAICPSGMVNTPMNAEHLKTVSDRIFNESYLALEGRGGIMEPTDMLTALMTVMTDSKYNGDLIAVNVNLGFPARLEPLDEFGSFQEYGNYTELTSPLTSKLIDYRIAAEFPHIHLWS